MPLNSHKIADKTIYAGLFFIAFAVVLASSYNPFNFRRMHVDSAVYMTIAQGITRGQLPYRDFVDNKGPLTYLLSAPGLLLGRFTGVWITELILMCVSVFFAYKTALFFGNKLRALLGTACGFMVFLQFFSVAAGTEEYSLPFLMISFYIFTKYYFSPERDISMASLIILGACFAFAVLIRLNMFPLWAGFCAVIFITSLANRRFAALGKYTLGFCAGIAIVFVPVFLYLKLNGILSDFFYQVIIGGAARGFDGSSIKQTAKNFFIVIDRYYSFAPLLAGVFWIITKYKDKFFLFYVGYTFSYILTVLFLSFSSGDSHYNVALIPFFIPAIMVFIRVVYSAFSMFSEKKRKIMLALFLGVIFSESLLKYFDNMLEIFYNDSGTRLINAGKIIDENTTSADTIISLESAYIYPFTKRNAASKYIYQGFFPGAHDEFFADVQKNKPTIIAIPNMDGLRYDYLAESYAPIYSLIAEKYRLLSDENGYYLFILNE
jgi:hypothetical protein